MVIVVSAELSGPSEGAASCQAGGASYSAVLKINQKNGSQSEDTTIVPYILSGGSLVT